VLRFRADPRTMGMAGESSPNKIKPSEAIYPQSHRFHNADCGNSSHGDCDCFEYDQSWRTRELCNKTLTTPVRESLDRYSGVNFQVMKNRLALSSCIHRLFVK